LFRDKEASGSGLVFFVGRNLRRPRVAGAGDEHVNGMLTGGTHENRLRNFRKPNKVRVILPAVLKDGPRTGRKMRRKEMFGARPGQKEDGDSGHRGNPGGAFWYRGVGRGGAVGGSFAV